MATSCKHHLSTLIDMGVFASVIDMETAGAGALPAADIAVCETALTELPYDQAAMMLNAIKHSGTAYIMSANPNDFLSAPPFYFRTPLWRFQENKTLTYDIWATADYDFFDIENITRPPVHNPTTTADLQQYVFFRKLCALPFVEEIKIYGSRSVGKSHPDSDLDLMLYCNPAPTREEWLEVCDIIDAADLPLEIDCKWDDGTLPTIFSAIDYVRACMRSVYQKPRHAV